MPRSTIYFYVREGLLPVAQKAAASRAFYSEAHLRLLEEISRLKKEGLPLGGIREQLAPELASARSTDIDLVAEQAGQVRQSILVAAARLFARKGYKRTRVADIIREVGVTPPVFYSHFPSKQALFVEAFGVFVGWMRGFLETRLAEEPDLAARDLRRVHGYLGVQTLSPDLMSLVLSEAMQEDGDLKGVVEAAFAEMTRGTLGDLKRLRKRGATDLPAPDELMAYGLLGGVENVVMRASWDRRYSVKDILRTTLCVFLGVEAIYTGRLDIRADFAKYEPLIDQLASEAPPVPPAALT